MKVAIAGYGLEGEANYRYWHAKGASLTIVDEKAEPARPLPHEARVLLGPNVFSKLRDFDLVVRTASLPPNNIVTDGKVWSSTNEFFIHCPAPIIGVTGTKGKGTTSSLITSILRAAGHTVHLVGNIGQPALAVLPIITQDDIVVFEISSFQLWDLERSPHVAVVLMIEPDHLDIHAGLADYVKAKKNISKHQHDEDVAFYHPTNKYSSQIAKAGVLGDRIRYSVADDGGVYVYKNNFCVQGEEICAVSNLTLPGVHNVENACAAISASRVFTLDDLAIAKGLRDFTGLPHRIKFVREVDGAKYYDDSYSSAPGATVAAVKSFTEPEILICGGYDRKIAYGDLAKQLSSRTNIKKIILIGQTRHSIAEALKKQGMDGYEVIDSSDFEQIVKRAADLAEPGDVVILSPGCASFDMFRDFTDRGEQFIKIVEGL